MMALVQRVQHASVKVNGNTVGQIGSGVLVLLGIHKFDTEKEVKWVANKVAKLRIFPDDLDRMNVSLLESGREVLVVSQFTLYGNTQKGNRPSFTECAYPERANVLYEKFAHEMENILNKSVATGIFGAMMKIELVNDGPVTLIVEKKRDSI